MDLALNNLRRLVCHKTQQTKPKRQILFIHIYLIYMIWLTKFNGMSNLFVYLMPNPLYTYIFNINDLV